MATKKVFEVSVVVDLSESFATDGGSYSCHTTQATRDAAAAHVRGADLVVYTADVHCAASSEFAANGGLFPPHHILATRGGDKVPGSSPRPVPELRSALAARRALVCAPRWAYFQSDSALRTGTPDFTASDLEREFGAPLAPQDMAAAVAMLPPSPSDAATAEGSDEKVTLLYSVKSCFNGVLEVPVVCCAAAGRVEGVPDSCYNAFTLLRAAYGLGEQLRFVVHGVVLSICVYQTATNIKQAFPRADVVVLAPACTALPGTPSSGGSWDATVRAMCEQIGVRYQTADK